MPRRLEKSPVRMAAVGTLEISSTPLRLRIPETLRFQREFFRLTFVFGIMMGPPSVKPTELLAVDALATGAPFVDAEANE